MADAHCRFWTVYSYVIAYRWETAPLQILAIVHGARQLETFFQQRMREGEMHERAAETGE